MKFAFVVILVTVAGATSRLHAANSILINFSSNHCSHCRAMEPILSQLERSGVPVRHVNVANEPDLARRYGIRKTPTFVVVSAGKEVTRVVGAQSEAQLRQALNTNPSGPLFDTGAKRLSQQSRQGPQTRLAPITPRPLAAPTSFPEIAAPSAPRSEAMPSLSVADAVQRAEAATVRLRVHDGHGYGVGTGTIIDVHGQEALVLTCGHLFRETQGSGRIEVDLFVGGQTRSVEGKVVDFDADARDIALVAIRPGIAIEPVQVVSNSQRVANGQPAFSFGCDRGADPSRRDTRITGIDKYNQHLGVSNLEIAGAPIDGRSGGGLFDQQGRLIGVCNSADYQGDVGIYAGPGNIHWQLDRVDLARLYQRPAGADSAAVASIASLPTPTRGDHVVPANITTATDPIGQEVIVIVRNPATGNAQPQVMTLANPSPELMQMIRRQSQ